MRALTLWALAALTPLADPDWLEPSVENEVEHAIEKARRATTAPAPTKEAREFVANATNGLDKTAIALRFVSTQKADGRWFDGTNDVTRAVLAVLETL